MDTHLTGNSTLANMACTPVSLLNTAVPWVGFGSAQGCSGVKSTPTP